MTCMLCRAKLPERANFCPICGIRLDRNIQYSEFCDGGASGTCPVQEPANMPSPEDTDKMPDDCERRGWHGTQRDGGCPPWNKGEPVFYQPDISRGFDCGVKTGDTGKRNTSLVVGLSLLAAVIVLSIVFIAAPNIVSGTGKAEIDEVVTNYFEVFESGGFEGFNELLLPEIVTYFISNGYPESMIPNRLDWWSGNYGGLVKEWTISSITELEPEETFLNEAEIDVRDLTRAADIQVEAEIEWYGYAEEMIFDFDMVYRDSKWYLVEVW